MKRKISFMAILAVSIATVTGLCSPPNFPDTFASGWKGGMIEEYVSADDLFLYMNGGAELYLEYRFTGLAVREYTAEDGISLTIEIYNFATPEDAYGIFSVDTSGTPVDIGQGGRRSALSTRFWKGQLFVRTFAWQSTPETEGIPDAAARAAALNIKEQGELPVWLNGLIQRNLRTSFIRGEIAMRQVAGSWQPEVLPIDRRNGAAWICALTPERQGALVLNYPTEEKTARAFQRIWTHLTENAQNYALVGQRGIAVQENGTAEGLETYKTNIIWTPDAMNEANCAEVLDLITAALSGREE